MSDIEYDDWMSESDALMWHMERDPVLRSTITTAWVLDTAPDRKRLDESITAAIDSIPRLRQRVVSDGRGIAPPKWESDQRFDPGYHVRFGKVAGDGTLRDLLDQAAPLAMQAFDKDRPLWELHVLEGMEDGRTGMVMKLHHAISDGVGLVKMTGALLDRTRDGNETRRPTGGDRPAPSGDDDGNHTVAAIRHRAETAARRSAAVGAGLGKGMIDIARNPIGSGRGFVDTAGSIARSLRPVSTPMSPIMGNRSMSVRFDALSTTIDRLKVAARTADGTLNDAYVAAVLGGLARYHRHHDAEVAELRMTMPINVREADDRGRTAGNKFAPARFAVPLDIDDPVERIGAINELVRQQRNEPAYARIGGISAALFALGPPAFTRLTGSMLKAIDFVTSNVPGPPFPVYSAGALVERNLPFGPLGGAGVNLTLFSYDGSAEIGINADRAAVPDGDVLTSCLQESFAEIESVG